MKSSQNRCRKMRKKELQESYMSCFKFFGVGVMAFVFSHFRQGAYVDYALLDWTIKGLIFGLCVFLAFTVHSSELIIRRWDSLSDIKLLWVCLGYSLIGGCLFGVSCYGLWKS